MTDLNAANTKARQPHAVLDLDSRRLKAIKIERLLDVSSRMQPMRMLEIGTGSGGIANYFRTQPELNARCIVHLWSPLKTGIIGLIQRIIPTLILRSERC